MKQYGWGIIGPGAIARRFMHDLPRCPRARMAAVVSRSAERAEAFADQYQFERCYDQLADFLADPALDIVYVATPHPAHHQMVIACLEAGKAVLCEKPLAVNGSQCREMIASARKNQTFLMEAMWTRFFPVSQAVKKLISSGELGQVTLMQIDFGFGRWQHGRVSDPQSRLFSPELAGGSLLDIGIYTLSYANFIKEMKPEAITALASMVETGVDGMTSMVCRYPDQSQAVMTSSVVRGTRQQAVIYCEHGRIEVPDFWHPAEARVYYDDPEREDQLIALPFKDDGATGFQYEAEAVMDALDDGRLEEPAMTWEQSQAVMDTMDEVRRLIGLRYPFE